MQPSWETRHAHGSDEHRKVTGRGTRAYPHTPKTGQILERFLSSPEVGLLVPGRWGRRPDGSGRLPGGGKRESFKQGCNGSMEADQTLSVEGGIWGGAGRRQVPKGSWTSAVVHLSLLGVRPDVNTPHDSGTQAPHRSPPERPGPQSRSSPASHSFRVSGLKGLRLTLVPSPARLWAACGHEQALGFLALPCLSYVTLGK